MSEMILNPETYFRNMVPDRSDLLQEIEEEARREEIPIVGPLVGELLHILARATGARRVLELGTATGYSTIFLAEACAATHGLITTLEWDEAMARRARTNLERAGLLQWTELKCANALEELTGITEFYDFLFLDIEKEDYLAALPHATRITRPGGFMVVDNVGFADATAFNDAIRAHPSWREVNLFAFLPEHSPEHDGLCLAVRI